MCLHGALLTCLLFPGSWFLLRTREESSQKMLDPPAPSLYPANSWYSGLQHPFPRETTSCSWPGITTSGNVFSLSGKDMFHPLFFFVPANLHSLESLEDSQPPACGFARAVVTKPFPPGAVCGTQPNSRCTSMPSL